MNVAFRVDASIEIGTGHFMRCLTLATGLKQRGAQVRFLSRHMPEHLRDMLNAKGHEMAMLNRIPNDGTPGEGSYAQWLGVSQAQDAADASHALYDQTWDWLVVDHYALDVCWETELRNAVKRILVIDDIAGRVHDCDVLLDQNFYVDMNARYAGKVPSQCQLLLGPSYALLREEFHHMRVQVIPRTGAIKRVLIFFGGVDADNCTGRAIEALVNICIPGLLVDVVIGAQHPCRNHVESECAQHGFICHVQTARMAELMAAADLAIGAGGSASWERCCLGLPALIVALADNQIEIGKALDLFGASIYLGSLEITSAPLMRRTIIDLVNHQSRVAALSEKSYSLVDGLGTDRVCQSLGY
jgi:UDP-2,4-diacetamido-2,4,6-trideoxy-beta-L-altropyranose hydrolase